MTSLSLPARIGLFGIGLFASSAVLFAAPTGADIYRQECARCHGPKGEGVADKYDEPLFGDRSIESLAKLIARTMPEDKEKKCSPEDAKLVAAYIYDAFYSAVARVRNQPPTVQLARLTVRQYKNTVADLAGSFRDPPRLDSRRGLNASYYNSRNFKDDKKAFERIDAQVQFQFGEATPDPEKMTTNEFAIRWRGSIIAEESGDYEFRITTENGARLYVNNDRRALIDAWVSAAGEVRALKETIHLLGGRTYPLQIEYFKFNDKTASLLLEWKPPHKTWEVIPQRHLSPGRTPATLVVSTVFPPDDSSVGYERGTAVSKAWDLAATEAAIEVAAKVVEQLDQLSSNLEGEDRTARVKTFCAEFARRAFRRPLTTEQREFFVRFQKSEDIEKAVKRIVLLVLKSPRFLYPELGRNLDDYHVASRLSFALWDSLPDKELLQAAAAGQLRTADEVTAQTQRMLKDPRTKSKMRDFFHHWLEMDEGEDISKDTQAYPDFNDMVLADLRTSLDLFLDHVVWDERSDYRQLLLADYLFLNNRLARFYGVDAPATNEFVRVSFGSKQRSGVVTHPYLLSTFSYHKSTSPIHRGVFLTRNIVGRALKPPPMAIEFMDGRFDPALTMREKVAELTRPEACQSCHSFINPLGFSLEHYDAVGRFRTTDNEKSIDASGEYTSADGEVVRLTGARDVAEYAARNEKAHAGFVQQLFHQTIKQPAAAFGPDTLENLRRSFSESGFNIQKLLLEIVRLAGLHDVPSTETKKQPLKDT